MLALTARVADFGNRGRRVLQEACAIGWIGPGFRNDTRAVARSDFLLIGLDQQVERNRIDIAFFGQHGFQGAYAHLGFRQLRMIVIVVVFVVMFGHGLTISKRPAFVPSSAP